MAPRVVDSITPSLPEIVRGAAPIQIVVLTSDPDTGTVTLDVEYRDPTGAVIAKDSFAMPITDPVPPGFTLAMSADDPSVVIITTGFGLFNVSAPSV